MKRQIPKLATPPKLDNVLINLLTKLCFMPGFMPITQAEADIIFVFGSRYGRDEQADTVHKLLEKNIANKVVLTGGSPQFDDLDQISHSEAEALLKEIKTGEFPEVEFYYENKSHHTLANVLEAMQVVDFAEFSDVIFVSKSHASRRCYLSLKTHMQDKNIISCSYDAIYPEYERYITRSSWHKFKTGQARVWGEYLRIKEYGQKGDIDYSECADLISKIEELEAIAVYG